MNRIMRFHIIVERHDHFMCGCNGRKIADTYPLKGQRSLDIIVHFERVGELECVGVPALILGCGRKLPGVVQLNLGTLLVHCIRDCISVLVIDSHGDTRNDISILIDLRSFRTRCRAKSIGQLGDKQQKYQNLCHILFTHRPYVPPLLVRWWC
ncbi:hypothetical protein D3C72_1954240 [compost metagenome]